MNNVITISREFGSGGRELGRKLAEYLGIYFFDREIVARIAEESQVTADYVDELFDRGTTMDFPVSMVGTISYAIGANDSTMKFYAKQKEVLEALAAQGDCVVVGRNGDVVLEDMKPFRIFVHSDMETKIRRCMDRAPEGENLTEKEMKKAITRVNRGRQMMHDTIADIPWGDKNGYHVCVNTSEMSIDDYVPALGEMAKAWFRKNREAAQQESSEQV